MRAILMIGGVITATLANVACFSMKQVTLDEVGAAKPTRVWVTLPNQPTMMIEGPQAFGDTLVGYVAGVYKEVPAGNADQLVVRQLATGRTAVLVAAGAMGVVGFAYAMTSSGGYKNPADLLDCEDDPGLPGCT